VLCNPEGTVFFVVPSPHRHGTPQTILRHVLFF
jgi:hypothetical protein